MNALKKNDAAASLSMKQIIAYGAGGQFSHSFYLMLQAYYMLFFLTNVLGFDTLTAAAIYTASQIIKVVTMFISGSIIDATSLRWGKYRSWIGIGTVLVTVFSVCMFLNLDIPTAPAVAIFITVYILQSFGYNVMWTACRAVVGPMAKNNADVVSLTSSAQAGTTIGGIIYGLCNAAILAAFAFTGQAYSITALLYGAIMVVGTIVILKITKPYDEPIDVRSGAGKRVSFKAMAKSMKGPMIPYFLSMLFGSAQVGFFFALLTYFTTYVLENPVVLGYSVTVYSICAFIGAIAARPICKHFTKKTVYVASTTLAVALYLILKLNGTNVIGFLVVYGLIGFAGSFMGVLLPAFANDLADYQEMTGEGNTPRAFMQSIGGTASRGGSLLSTSIASFGLAAIGYHAGEAMSAPMLASITDLMVIGPAIVCALSIVFILCYRVDEKQIEEFRAQKAMRREAEQNEAADSEK